jgi:uncharacterized SAM-binding protein YcdF (DUF218 family)
MLSAGTRISVVPERFFSSWRGRKRKIRDENTRRFTSGFGDNIRQFFICANSKYAMFRAGTAAVSALHLVCVLFLAIAGCGLFTLRHLGEWLAVDDPLQHSTALVVPGGGTPFRAIEAAGLYRARWASEVWVTQGPRDEGDAALKKMGITTSPEHELSRKILMKLGVPTAAIQVVPGSVNNTAAELAANRRL